MSCISSLVLPHWLKMADWDVWTGSSTELLSFLATTHSSAAEDIKHDSNHVLRVGYLPGTVAANHCPSPAGPPRRGAEVITVWLRLLFGSIVWRRSSRAGILGNRSMLPWGTSELTKQSLTEMSRDHHNGWVGGGGTSIFSPIFSSFFLFVPIPIRCIQRHKVFSLRLPLLHLWVIEKVAEQEEQLVSRYFSQACFSSNSESY